MSESKQPFRAGDIVEVILGTCAGERWVIAVYEADRDTAYIAGWPCTMVTKATEALRRVEAVGDEEHSRMVAAVSKMQGDRGQADPRRSAIERVLASGGTP